MLDIPTLVHREQARQLGDERLPTALDLVDLPEILPLLSTRQRPYVLSPSLISGSDDRRDWKATGPLQHGIDALGEGPRMHVHRMRLQTLQVMLRTLQRCTVSSVGHQVFPARVPEPRHEVRTHVPYAIRMVRTWGVHPFLASFSAALIALDLSEMTRRPCWGVTCLLKFDRKKDQASIVSDSTSANAIGKILSFPSYATAINKTPPYFPYRWVPLMEMKFLQCLNASMHGGNDQKTLSNCRAPWSSRFSS
ncbi:hypothetical protein PIB30_084168 [Stylosanthes scabra]|uniref:Uncharacterized protein n=1 Tax=Stylosanthes scabra TaxID=79078 RepID=A0ABU6YT86_9FABA|nr:hypothetical protein [Stylosanthes scabra]